MLVRLHDGQMQSCYWDKINYYGDPKKLSDEFLRFNYQLKDNRGYWELEIND